MSKTRIPAIPVISAFLIFFVTWLPVSAQCNVEFTIENLPYYLSTYVSQYEYHCYYLTVASRTEITVTVTPASSNVDPDLYVESCTGIIGGVLDCPTTIASSYMARGETDSVTFTAEPGTIYRIMVYGFMAGTYYIEVTSPQVTTVVTTTTPVIAPTTTPSQPSDWCEPNDDSSQPCFLGSNIEAFNYWGYMTPDDIDWYRISFSYPVELDIIISQSEVSELSLVLYDGSHSIIACDFDSSAPHVHLSYAAADFYDILVYTSTNEYGNYNLEILARPLVTPTTPTTTTTTPTEQPIGGAPTQPSNPITDFLNWVSQQAQGAWDWLSQQSQDVQEWFSQQSEGVQNMINQAVSQAVNNTIAILMTPINMIKNAVTTIFDTITSTVTQAVNYITQPILSVFQAIGNVFRGIAETINSVVRSVFGFGGTRVYAPLTVTEVIAT